MRVLKESKRLTEANIKPQKGTTYVDTNTGKRYMWDGKKFVVAKKNKPGQGGKDQQDQKDKSNDQQQDQSGKGSNQPSQGNKPTQGKSQTPRDTVNPDPRDPRNRTQIGDRGDQAIQDQEDEERRQANAQAGQAEESESDYKDRIERIRKMISDPNYADEVVQSTYARVDQDKADRKAERYRNSGMARFKDSFEGFIKQQIMPMRKDSWSKLNKKYSHTNLLKPGRQRSLEGKAIVVNVYFDQSGSWSADDIKVGESAVGVINNYVHRGEVVMNLYYFSNKVCNSPDDPNLHGGTSGQPILDHIKRTNPDNVVILTDSDISDCREVVEVPGGVWLLWLDGKKSENLANHIKGKQVTKEFSIDSNLKL